jgi:hypothetical protein
MTTTPKTSRANSSRLNSWRVMKTMKRWSGLEGLAQAWRPVGSRPEPHFSYTPHLPEKTLTSKSEDEAQQVTVLFAGPKGSLELLANDDPEEACQFLFEPMSLGAAITSMPGSLDERRADGAERQATDLHNDSPGHTILPGSQQALNGHYQGRFGDPGRLGVVRGRG